MHSATASQHPKLIAKRSGAATVVIGRFAVPAVVFTASFILYWSSAARHPGWVDATLILSLVRNLQLGVWANVHNLFNLVGYAWLRIFAAADPHFALTMLCSLFGSLTVLFVYKAGLELTGNILASGMATVALTLSLSLWWHSTTIEVYTLNTTLIALFLYCVFRAYRKANPRSLYLAFFFGGLGISNHVLMGLYVFAFMAVLLPFAARDFRLKAGGIAGLVGCYLAGASIFASLFILHWLVVYKSIAAGSAAGTLLLAVKSLAASLRFATGGHFLKSMFTSGLTVREKLFWRGNYLFLILLSYPSAAVVFIVAGLPRLWKCGGSAGSNGAAVGRPGFQGEVSHRPASRGPAWRGPVLFFLVGIAAQIVWSANYFIWDMYAFALPVYLMLSIPLIAGIDGFLKKHRVPSFRWLIFLTFLIPAVLYPSFSRWPNREKTVDRYIALYPEAKRTGGLWDPAEYIFNPIKRNYTATADFSEGVLRTLPKGAAYWDDESKAAYPLEFYYQEIKGRRRDVNLNRVFGLVMEESDAQRYAQRLLGQLNRRERVYVSALVEPEREILNQVFHLLDPGTPIEQIRSKDLSDFRASFPEFEIVDTPVVADGSLQIYELRPRNSGL